MRIWPAAALGVLASWLHPWQGETLIVIIGMTALLWLRSGRRPAKRTLALAPMTVVATLVPLLYYVALAHLDPQWGLARVGSKHLYSVAARCSKRSRRCFSRARRRTGGGPSTSFPWRFGCGFRLPPSSSSSRNPDSARRRCTRFAGITIPLSILSVEGVMSSPAGG